MTLAVEAPIVAAGAVCWRRRKGIPQILVVHRSRHDDVSLPKGKVDPGEAIPVTAVREVREETGYAVALGLPLGTTEYTVPGGRDKVVYYWAAEVTKTELETGRFRPTEEVQRLEWVSVPQARKSLTYQRDREVLERFAALADSDALQSFALLILRHAKADLSSSDGADAGRPLTERGRQQAVALVPILAAWAPKKLLTSPATRCRQTLEPLARELKLTPTVAAAIAQDAWEPVPREATADATVVAALRRLIAKRVRKQVTAVLCSHTPVLLRILQVIAETVGHGSDQRLLRSAMLSTGEFCVVHLSVSDPTRGILAVETHSSLV